MRVLTVAVVFAVVLGLLNLLFTFGVVRRLREHARLLADPDEELVAALGSAIRPFTAVTIDGDVLHGPASISDSLVGFFTPGCAPCGEIIPDFVTAAGEATGGRAMALAVVVGTADAAADYITQLQPVARVVVEPPDGSVAQAFQVRGFPAIVTVGRDGRIASHGLDASVPASA